MAQFNASDSAPDDTASLAGWLAVLVSVGIVAAFAACVYKTEEKSAQIKTPAATATRF